MQNDKGFDRFFIAVVILLLLPGDRSAHTLYDNRIDTQSLVQFKSFGSDPCTLTAHGAV